MADWVDYVPHHDEGLHTVVGTLKVLPQLSSKQLGNSRDILVWLPPTYLESKQRYPVIYMHDGQNLFDRYTSFVGEWEVDETLTALASEKYEAIVVGIPSISEVRGNELSPFDDKHIGDGRGSAYMSFLLDSIKPIVDSDFRTLTDTANTGLMGSSMGGLISLYGLFRDEHQFGFVGAMSPYFGAGDGAIYEFVKHAPFRKSRIYMDVGTHETDNLDVPENRKEEKSLEYLESVRLMRDLLIEKGYTLGDSLDYVEDVGAVHNEGAWAKRLPCAMRFLLASTR